MNNEIEILKFIILNGDKNEIYGINTKYINEVYFIKNITFLPCTQSFIIGIINFRGRIISVVDIRNFLGINSEKINLDSIKKVIIISNSDIEFAIAIEDVIRCEKISLNSIQNNIYIMSNLNEEYIKGITIDKCIILNMKNILSSSKIIIEDKI